MAIEWKRRKFSENQCMTGFAVQLLLSSSLCSTYPLSCFKTKLPLLKHEMSRISVCCFFFLFLFPEVLHIYHIRIYIFNRKDLFLPILLSHLYSIFMGACEQFHGLWWVYLAMSTQMNKQLGWCYARRSRLYTSFYELWWLCRVNLNKEHEEILLSYAERRFESEKLLADIWSLFFFFFWVLGLFEPLLRYFQSFTLVILLLTLVCFLKVNIPPSALKYTDAIDLFSITEMSVYMEKKKNIASRRGGHRNCHSGCP